MHMRTYLPVSSCACMNGPEGKGSGGYHDNITPSQVPLHFMSLYNPIFQECYFLLFFFYFVLFWFACCSFMLCLCIFQTSLDKVFRIIIYLFTYLSIYQSMYWLLCLSNEC